MTATARDGMLKARPLPFDTFRENVAVLARDNVVLRPARLVGVRRLEVKARGLTMVASPMIADAQAGLACDEIGLPQPAFRRLGIAAGDLVESRANPAPAQSRRRARQGARRDAAPRR